MTQSILAHVCQGLTRSTTNLVLGVLISSRNIALIFTKFGRRFPIHVCIHLMNFFIVSLSHLTHLRLVMVNMFHRKWRIVSQTVFALFYSFLWLLAGALECYLLGLFICY